MPIRTKYGLQQAGIDRVYTPSRRLQLGRHILVK